MRHILSTQNQVQISDDEISRLGDLEVTGRDIKNLLKLAMLRAEGKPITKKDIEFVMKFNGSSKE